MDLVVLLRECALCAIRKVQKPYICQAALNPHHAGIQLHDIVNPFVCFAADIVKNNAHVNTSIYLQVTTIQLVKDGNGKGQNAEDEIQFQHCEPSKS